MNNKDTNNIKYNKSTYVGFLKIKNGGMKIIPGEKDNYIINKRDNILNHLDLVLSGEKKLKEKNINKYFKALGGKYVRNDMCTIGDLPQCKKGKNISIGGADKLLKLASQKNFSMQKILASFKGSAPSLYENLEMKIVGSNNKDNEFVSQRPPEKNYSTGMYGYTNDMNGGEISNLELNNLRDEINKIRNNL